MTDPLRVALHALVQELQDQADELLRQSLVLYERGAREDSVYERGRADAYFWNAKHLSALLVSGRFEGLIQEDDTRVDGVPDGAHGDLPRPATE